MVIDFCALVDRELMKESDYGKNDLNNHFHPSCMGYCKRQIFLSKLNLKTFQRDVKGSMQMGTIIHNYIQYITKSNIGSMNVDVEKEVSSPVHGEIFFKGRIDIVNEGIPYELKSIDMPYPPMIPKDEHEEQRGTHALRGQKRPGRLKACCEAFRSMGVASCPRSPIAYKKISFCPASFSRVPH